MAVNYWNENKVKMLINSVQKSPALWKRKSPLAEKELDWHRISRELRLPANIVEKKYKELLGTYRTILRRVRNDKNYKPTWKYFSNFSFLEVGKISDKNSSLKNNEQVKENSSETIDLASNELTQQPPNRTEFKVSLTTHWSCENTIKFLNLVRAHHVIWDDSNSGYVETTAQKNAWEEIVEEMNLPVDVLKEKFKSLCSTYYSIRKEIAKDPLYVISWLYFSYMEFMPMPATVLKAIAAIKAKKIGAITTLNTDVPQQATEINPIAVVELCAVNADTTIEEVELEHKFESIANKSAVSSTLNSDMQHKTDEVNPIATDQEVNALQEQNLSFASTTSIDSMEQEHAFKSNNNNSKSVNRAKNQTDKNTENIQEMQISSTSKNNTDLSGDTEISDYIISRDHKKQTKVRNRNEKHQKPIGNQNLKRFLKKESDEYDIFGKVVANEMRKLGDFELTQKIFKQKVERALFEASQTAQYHNN